MKTPDEIKKGLECCLGDCHNYHCEECPYMNPDTEDYDGCSDNGKKLAADALALIQQLEAQNAELLEKVEQLQAERDAAVRELEVVAEKAEQVDAYIDDYIHADVDYSTYLAVRNMVDNIVNWEYESEWRGVSKEK